MIARWSYHLKIMVIFAAIGQLLLAGPAEALTQTRSMSCSQAKSMLQGAGSLVMTTGPNTFAQVYSISGACRASRARPQSVPTRDNPNCNVGFVCLPRTGGR